jgi:hypothetical protein
MLVLLYERHGQPDGEVWFTPDVASERFKLASSTRSAGLQELRTLGIVQTRKGAGKQGRHI